MYRNDFPVALRARPAIVADGEIRPRWPELLSASLHALAVAFVLAMQLVSATEASAARGDCGQPKSEGANPAASDALAILTAAVSATPACPLPAPSLFPLCRCDANASGKITAADALLILRVAVGLIQRPDCASCSSMQCGGDSCAFITGPLHDGNTNGLEGSDAICDQLAADAGLAGTYRAWRSQNSPRIDAIERLPKVGPWRRVDGALVAVDHADLTDGTIASTLNVAADGSVIALNDFIRVTTGTKSNGTLATGPGGDVAADVTCKNWTDNGDDIAASAALLGSQSHTDENWTSASGWLWCSYATRFYCFEVSEPKHCFLGDQQLSEDRCRTHADCPVNECIVSDLGPHCSLTGNSCPSQTFCPQLLCH